MIYNSDINRSFITRLVFGVIFLILLLKLFSHTLLHQLESPVLKFAFIDPIYLLFTISGFSEFIIERHWLSLIIDILMMVSVLAVLIYPLRRIYVIVFSVAYFIYFIIYNLYGMHHVHSTIGILFIVLPFWAKTNRRFDALWEAVRYYTLLIYSIAFFWKLIRGSWFNSGQALAILQYNLSEYIFHNPEAWQTDVYTFFIQNHYFLDILHIVAIAMEGVFMIGFFTKRFDHWLILNGIVLHLGIIFFVDADFTEILILYFTLVNYRYYRENYFIRPAF
jgi:hypothetical protein